MLIKLNRQNGSLPCSLCQSRRSVWDCFIHLMLYNLIVVFILQPSYQKNYCLCRFTVYMCCRCWVIHHSFQESLSLRLCRYYLCCCFVKPSLHSHLSFLFGACFQEDDEAVLSKCSCWQFYRVCESVMLFNRSMCDS